jgi:transglutaminase-like putative cysteine protease
MKIQIQVALDYALPQPTDLLLQLEAAHLPEQSVSNARLDLSSHDQFARVPAQDEIGERILLRAHGSLSVRYEATVEIMRQLADISTLPALPVHRLPGPAIPYLLDSAYCPARLFERFVEDEFGYCQGGARIAAMRDFLNSHIRYVPGASNVTTTAQDAFLQREGVCRDFAHVLITMARASSIPARYASVYALGVDPPDFHAVAEVFLDGAWHLVDATGMALEGTMAKIGIGRDATDVSFLTSFGEVHFQSQSVDVREAKPLAA